MLNERFVNCTLMFQEFVFYLLFRDLKRLQVVADYSQLFLKLHDLAVETEKKSIIEGKTKWKIEGTEV